jgi:light-regulated signal transduction histidine kinase (bacteriophytochrome)
MVGSDPTRTFRLKVKSVRRPNRVKALTYCCIRKMISVFRPPAATKAAGTGVGLTICRVIVEAHGGTLEVCANEPYGAIFHITLPAGREEYRLGESPLLAQCGHLQ